MINKTVVFKSLSNQNTFGLNFFLVTVISPALEDSEMLIKHRGGSLMELTSRIMGNLWKTG